MEKESAPLDARKNLLMALFKSLLIPVLLLAFFIAAPRWLDSKLHSSFADAINADAKIPGAVKAQELETISRLDFQEVSLNCPAGMEAFHANLAGMGVVGNFQRLRWGLLLSIVLVSGLVLAAGTIYGLNGRARQSRKDLIHCFRLGWTIGMAAALAKVFLLIPLLAYGTFEFSVLLTDRFFPKLLLAIILGGLFALWKSAAILLHNVPLEFEEDMSREVTPEDAPELWQAVRNAASRLQTTPPDRILIGLQLNFYVTELAVKFDGGRAEGKTLFLSYPVLKQLSEEEALAVIGHELGHFIGEDTRLTRDFYPLRLKIHATMIAMAASGWVGWPSFQFLNFFNWCFNETEQAASRARELLADKKSAELATPQTAARALVRFQVAAEAFGRGFQSAIKNRTGNPLDIPLRTIVREQLAAEPAFWAHLFEQKLPHPLDSHPPLQVRLEALGQTMSVAEAQNIALEDSESACEKWFSRHEALFANLTQQAEAAVEKIRSRTAVAEADYKTDSGKQLLDQLFPEKRWRAKSSYFWTMTVMLGIVGFAFLAVAVFVNEPLVARTTLAGLAAFIGMGIAIAVKRHCNTELILNAAGLQFTGWKRPLGFEEVRNISVRRVYSNVILTFHFKAKMPPIRKFAIFRLPVKTANLSLSGFGGRPLDTAQIIFDYFARQMKE
jgi:Zn-dependent protease with chaperone function